MKRGDTTLLQDAVLVLVLVLVVVVDEGITEKALADDAKSAKARMLSFILNCVQR
jgi:hypothetical protein